MGNIFATTETEACTGTRDGKTEEAAEEKGRRGSLIDVWEMEKIMYVPDLYTTCSSFWACEGQRYKDLCLSQCVCVCVRPHLSWDSM